MMSKSTVEVESKHLENRKIENFIITNSKESHVDNRIDYILSNEELIILQDIFSDEDDEKDSTSNETDNKNICKISFKRTKKPLIPLENFREFHMNFQRYINSKDLSEIYLSSYELMHSRCLVRFNCHSYNDIIHAKVGPNSFIQFLIHLFQTFMDGESKPFKVKELEHNNFYIIKSKSTFIGTESNFTNTLNLGLYISPIEYCTELIERKENYSPLKILVKFNATAYIDMNINKIVLLDLGLKSFPVV